MTGTNTVIVSPDLATVTVTSPGPQGPAGSAPPTLEYAVGGGTAGTQPTFSGDPLFTGRYARTGDLVHFVVSVLFTNITSFGTGQYYVTLPFPTLLPLMARDGCLHDDDTGRQYHVGGHAVAGSSQLDLWTTDRVGNSVIDAVFAQGAPVTLATADSFHIQGTYIAEPAV